MKPILQLSQSTFWKAFVQSVINAFLPQAALLGNQRKQDLRLLFLWHVSVTLCLENVLIKNVIWLWRDRLTMLLLFFSETWTVKWHFELPLQQIRLSPLYQDTHAQCQRTMPQCTRSDRCQMYQAWSQAYHSSSWILGSSLTALAIKQTPGPAVILVTHFLFTSQQDLTVLEKKKLLSWAKQAEERSHCFTLSEINSAIKIRH